MDPNAYSNDGDTDQQPDSYWRRRVITLAAGLCLLGLLAWAFSGGGGKSATPAVKTSQASGVLPAAAYSGPPSSPTAAAASAAASPSVSGLPAAAASASGKAADRKSAKSGPGQARATKSASAVTPASTLPGGGCAPGAVVLSLASSKSVYYSGQDPEFDIYAVSTASGNCSFPTSAAKLDVVVKSAGRIIWEASDCDRGDTDRTTELRRGVPAQESVSWNRTITLPGCVTLASVRPGTYEVQVKTATVASPVRTIKLERLTLV